MVESFLIADESGVVGNRGAFMPSLTVELRMN